MKGVVLSINPEATVVDISHDLPAHDIPFAAHELAATYRYYPAGTIFLVVVDPGVGSSRRGLAVEAGEWRFVAPDNGVLTAVLQETPAKEGRRAHGAALRAADGQPHVRRPGSLCAGRGLAVEGRSTDRARAPGLRLRASRSAEATARRFGAAWRRHPHRSLRQRRHESRPAIVRAAGRWWRRAAPDGRRTMRSAESCRRTPRLAPDEIGALFGSTDQLECASNASRAADRLGVGVGAPVELRRLGLKRGSHRRPHGLRTVGPSDGPRTFGP